MLKEKHELPSIAHEFYHQFFLSFCECLGTFSCFSYTPGIFQSFYSFSEAKRFFISSRIANPDGQHSVIVASNLKLTRWSYLISNAIDINKETLREKNTSIMIMSRKNVIFVALFYLFRIETVKNRMPECMI